MSKENEEILIKFVGTVRLEKNRYVITIPKQSAEALKLKNESVSVTISKPN